MRPTAECVLADCNADLGRAWDHKRGWSTAIEFYNKSLDIISPICNQARANNWVTDNWQEKRLLLLISVTGIGNAYITQAIELGTSFDPAIAFLIKSLAIYRAAFGEAMTADVYHNIGI